VRLDFEWDEAKAARNFKKHKISFEEAKTVFDDPHSTTVPDTLHPTPGEDRFITRGMSSSGRMLQVVHSDQGDRIRIISARRLLGQARRRYEEGE
jgi:uncharacterized protein